MISFSQVNLSYSKKTVLDHVDLTIAQGETLGLIGANGEGKTSLFKCMLNACQINSGEISINNIPHRFEQARNSLAFLPENFQAAYYFKGHEFLAWMMGMYHTPYQEEKIHAVLKTLLFDPVFLDQHVRTYSKGMMQKLGLTACLCSQKSILVLDEPMSGLDPTARYGLKKLLIEQKQQGKTLIFSTHLLHDIESLCESIAILAKNKIRFHGKLDDALTRFKADSLEQAYLNCLQAL